MHKYIRQIFLSLTSFLFIISTCSADDVNQTNSVMQQSNHAYGLMNYAGDESHPATGFINLYNVAGDGMLTLKSSTKVGGYANGIVFSDNGAYAYELDYYTNIISIFRVSADTGELTLIGTTDIQEYASFSIVQRGGYIYVTAASNSINGHVYTYSIAKDGMLTRSSSAITGASPLAIAFSANGKYAYVSNYADNTVSMYNVNNGVLKPLSPKIIQTSEYPTVLTFDPRGNHVYVVNLGDVGQGGSVSMYNFSPTDGLLTLMSTVPTGVGPDSIAFDQKGKFAYITNYDTLPSTLSSYSVSTAGGLSPLPTMKLEPAPTDIVFDPSGKYVYVSSFSGITKYSFSTDGKLIQPQYIPVKYGSLMLKFPPNNSIGMDMLKMMM